MINVGCGQRITVNDLARLMAAAMLGRPDLTPVHHPERAGDLKHSFADLTRSQALLGYEPIVDFRTGLEQTVQWYESVLPVSPARRLGIEEKPGGRRPGCADRRRGTGVERPAQWALLAGTNTAVNRRGSGVFARVRRGKCFSHKY